MIRQEKKIIIQNGMLRTNKPIALLSLVIMQCHHVPPPPTFSHVLIICLPALFSSRLYP